MRALLVTVLALAACSPEIAPGAYLCGPEQACPDGLACTGTDTTCVLPSAVQPFACGPTTEVEPNDGFATAQVVLPDNLACVSSVVEVVGCTPDTDGEDWFALAVPATCAASAIEARVAFPIAYEVLGLEVRDEAGATVGTGTPCTRGAPDDGDDRLCLDTVVTPGQTYAVRVARSGVGDCGGQCAYNRYTLTLQLTTP